jgi:hypothetical protein
MTLLFGAILLPYRYTDTLSEYDLYSVALGIWHGEMSGQGLHSSLHYYVWLSFGYIAFLDLIATPAVLTDQVALTHLMNDVGFCATLAIPPLCWLALRGVFGTAAAALGTGLFILSPIFLDVAGSAHPLLPALAFYFLGVALMSPAPDGWRGVSLWAGATAAFAMSLLMRFELAFAFPFFVLAHPRTENLRAFAAQAALRAVPGVIAIAIYFLARSALLGQAMWSETGAFFGQWYSLAHLSKGVVAAVLATGLGLGALAIYALATQAAALVRAASGWPALAHLLAPLGVIGAALLIWLPNPLPARHFVLFTFALAALAAAVLMRRRSLSVWAALGLALSVSAVSQAAAALTAPLVSSLSPSDLRAPVGVLVPAPAEPAWIRRAALKARGVETLRLAERIAADACAQRLVVVTDQAPALLGAFTRPVRAPQIFMEGAVDGAFQYHVRDGAREVLFVQRTGAASAPDIVGRVLAHPRYAGMMIFVDPLTRQHADVTEPPPARTEMLSCGAA